MSYICTGQPYMNWNKLRLTVIGVILLTMSACIRDRIPEGADLRPGDSLPWFSVTMDDGSVLTTDDLTGKVSVIVFFHTGCPDCQAELPVIQRIHDEFSPEAAVICISREEDAADIAEYWAENGLTLPYSAQKDRTVYSLFASEGVPRVYVSSGSLFIHSIYDDSPVATYENLVSDIRVASTY